MSSREEEQAIPHEKADEGDHEQPHDRVSLYLRVMPPSSGVRLRTCRSVAVKVEAISIDIFHGELTQTPGFFLEGLHDSGAQGAQFLVRGVDFRRKYPVNGRFEWTRSSATEDRDVVTALYTDLHSWRGPPGRTAS